MADDVQVTFSASIERLVKGVEEGTSAIKGFAEHVETITGAAGKVATALAEAFAVEKILGFVEKMAELGEQVIRTSAILGTSTKETQELGFIAKITGVSADSLALSMERLQLNLAKAQSGTAPAAQALQALGLRAKDLIGLPLPEQLNKIADAVAKFADGGNKTAIVMALLGRGGAQMIPVLDQGAHGLDHLKEKADEFALSPELVEQLGKIKHGLTEFEAATTKLSAVIVVALAPAIDAATGGLTKFVVGLADVIEKGHGAAIAINLLVLAAGLLTLNFAQAYISFKKLQDLIEESAKEGPLKVTVHGNDKPQPPAFDPNKRDTLAAAMKEIDEEVKLVQEGLARKKLIWDAEVAQFRLTEDSKFKLLQQATDQAYGEQVSLLQRELQLDGLKLAQRQAILNKLKELESKHDTEMIRLDEQSIAAMQAKWTQALGAIEGAFNSQLRGLLAGTTTWAQAFKNMLGDLLIKFIEFVEQLAVKWAAGQLAQLTATQSGAAAQATAETAGQELTLPARIAKFESDLLAAASIGAANAYAALAAFPPAAAAAAAAAFEGITSLGQTGVPKLDTGGFVVSSGLAMIHAGETVLPAQVSPLASGSGGPTAGSSVQFNVSAIDAAGVAAFFRQHGDMLAKILVGRMNDNPSLRGAW